MINKMTFFKKLMQKDSYGNKVENCDYCATFHKSFKTCGNCSKKICTSCFEEYKLCMNCDEEYEEWVTSLQELKEKTEKKKKYNYKDNDEAELTLLI